MKKRLFLFVIPGLILITFTVNSQNSTFPIKKINGVEYYIYTVQAKEGIYAISKKFNVTQAEINNSNPTIGDGLKIGQQLIIPKNKTFEVKEKVVVQQPKQQFIQHTVEKKQTLFAISRLYEVSQEDILKFNPDITKKLKTGTILQIPVKSANQVVSNTNKHKEIVTPTTTRNKFKLHIVQKNETLFSISKLFDVTIDEIISLNPGVEKKLSIGTELKIPLIKSNTTQDKVVNDTSTPNSATALDLTKIFEKTDQKKSVYKIAFLLPFMLGQNNNTSGSDRFIEFYTGALLAAYTAKEKGISLEITTYDTEKTAEKLDEVLLNTDLKSMDLIIGPAFSNQISIIAEYAKTNKINTLIPFSSKVPTIEDNPYLFQFNPGIDIELKFTKELLTEKYQNSNLIFAEIPNVNEFDEGNVLFNSLKKELLNSKRLFTMFELSTPEYTDFSSQLKKGKQNIILFNTDKYSQVQTYLNTLKSNTENYDILLLEKFSWLNQADKSIKGIYISPFASDYNKLNLSNYNTNYSKFFNPTLSDELPRFDLLGYDLTCFFIDYFNKNGKKINENISTFKSAGFIQSQPNYQKSDPKSGYINNKLYFGEVN